MKKLAALYFASLLAVATVSQADAQSYSVTYDFGSVTTASGTTDPTTVPTATGLTFGSFSAVGYTGNSSGAGRFSFTGNPTGSANGVNDFSTFTGSLNSSIYYSVTITPLAGYTLNLDTIAFTSQRSSTGIRSYAVRSSLDSYAANLPASISPANANLGVGGANDFQVLFDATTTAQNGSLVTLDAAYDALASAVTFRFYGWNAEANTGTFSIDNVNFIGSVTAVPEPSMLTLASLGGAAFFFLVRRKH